MREFVHLHNHSDYSLLDGASPVKGMAERALEIGCQHLALTDHGNLFGAAPFYKACRAAKVHPIIGCEVYLSPGSRLIKKGNEMGNNYYHLILLAKNTLGYRNLMRLVSIGYLEGFYYKPRIDFETLSAYSQGLICLSACIAGELPQLILSGREGEAEKLALRYGELFGPGNYYLEIQDHGLKEEMTTNRFLAALSQKTGLPLAATNDSHYLRRDDANAQDILMCIGMGKKKNEDKRLRFTGQEFYLKTPEEMAALFPSFPQALDNTLRIAEDCTLEIPFPGPEFPEFAIPQGFASPEDYLRHLCSQGLVRRYGTPTQEILNRAEYEVNTIIAMGFTGYFLIVWDYIHWARSQGIPVGPGRGSGAGSIVAYAMTITDIDPIKYNLLFERFLNSERVSLPDFDIDFCYERRQEVIDYIKRKYGEDKVGQIITFGSLKAKQVIRDVARVLDIPYGEADGIAKLVPGEINITLQQALEKEPKLKNLSSEKPEYQELLEVSLKLEGLNRHAGTHAAGIVIGKHPLTDYVPLYRDPKTFDVSTQYSMKYLEDCGLVKMDFLGLKTLTLIKNTEELIRKFEPDFSAAEVDENDPAVFAMLGEGKSACVFQFESPGMQDYLQKLKPGNIEELIALNALYRPGPMAYIPKFIDSKNGRIPISYPDPALEDLLKPTYGVFVYQEQVIQAAQIIAGFSLGKADILRRAMSKKLKDDLKDLKADFLTGAEAKGHSREQAKTIFELLEPFSEYGFNKSHAAAYSVLAYRTAYLKAHYPAQFMAANLSNEISDRDKMSDYIRELKKMDLTLAPPDINASDKSFTVQENRILYGLVGIKNVGEAAVEEILSSRKKDGPFLSLTDFLRRLDLRVVNRKVVEALIQAGAFDAMGMGRARLFSNLDRLIQFVEGQKESLSSGQNSLFDEDHREFTEIELSPVPEYPRDILLAHEKELLGYYASGHPLEPYRELWEKLTTLDLRIFGGRGEGSEEEEGPEESSPGNLIPGAPYTLVGLASGVKTRFTKSGGKMATAMIEDFNGSLEMLFFPKAWGEAEDRVKNDAVLVVTGKVDQSRNNPQFLVDEVKSPEESLRGLKAFEPLEPYRNLYGEKILSLGERELSQAVPGAAYTLLGILRNLRTFTSKKGEAMAQGTLEDFFGRMDLLFFPRIWEKEEENIREGRILGVSGKIDHFRNARQFLVNQVISPENLGALPARRERGGRKGADKPKKAPAGNAPALHIRLLRERINPDSLEELREFLLPHQGESPIFFHVPRKAPEGTGEDVVIRASRRIAVHLDSLNLKALEEHPLTGDVWKE